MPKHKSTDVPGPEGEDLIAYVVFSAVRNVCVVEMERVNGMVLIAWEEGRGTQN